MMKFRRRGDLAILETAAIGLSAFMLGALVVPDVLEERSKSKPLQALADTQRIAVGIHDFQTDTGKAPDFGQDESSVEILTGPGEDSAGPSWIQGKTAPLSAYLLQNTFQVENWKGPYLRSTQKAENSGLSPDPWGHSYLVFARAFSKGDEEKVWVLCAGPNGKIDTSPTDRICQGDDIGVTVH